MVQHTAILMTADQ